ncbi:MAG: polyprenyl diphosphate synthase [Candidatus Eutrophobiaceae bacterium]
MNEPSPKNAQPWHVAIIMDGNGRWAKQRKRPRIAGHHEGVATLKRVVRDAAELGIGALTVYAFSSENWQRPKEEVDMLMRLFFKSLRSEVNELHEHAVRLRFIGARSSFSRELRDAIVAAEELTAGNQGLNLNVAADYGGRWDIVQACQKLIEQGRAVPGKRVTEAELAAQLSLANFPDPDLFIRTAGERRISNYLLWQLAYTELYFTDVLWPEFTRTEFKKALQAYAQRQRRFGRTAEQLQACEEPS